MYNILFNFSLSQDFRADVDFQLLRKQPPESIFSNNNIQSAILVDIINEEIISLKGEQPKKDSLLKGVDVIRERERERERESNFRERAGARVRVFA